MQLGTAYKVHTSEYKHIRRVKRERILLLLLLYIVCLYIFYCSRFQAFIFYCSHLRAFTDPITPHFPFIRIGVVAALGRPRKKPRIYTVRSRCHALPGHANSTHVLAKPSNPSESPHNTRHAGFNELYLNLPRTGSVYATEPIRLFTDG